VPIVEPKGGHTPPPARKPRTTSAPKPSVVQDILKDVRKKRNDGVIEFFGMLSAVSFGFGWLADAATYQMHGPTLADEAVKMGESNEKVGALLDKWAEIAPVGNLVAAVGMMGLQLAANHGLISVERAVLFGASDPQILESEMRIRVQMEIMEKRQQAAERERQAAQLAAEIQGMESPRQDQP